MPSPPLASQVSVIVPTHSRAAMLVECLDALLTQSVNALEIIVVDDASTDGTQACLSAWVKRDARVKERQGRE